MATKVSKQFTTVSVPTAGDTITTRHCFAKFRNLGANIVSISESANPTAAITAGSQTSLNPMASTGPIDFVILFPNTVYYVRAVSGATLCGVEEFPASKNEI